MRRTLALLALLATTWPQVTVMACAMGAASHHDADGASVAAEHTHDGPECQAVLTCNASMIEGRIDGTVAEPTTPPLLHSGSDASAPTIALPTADPPPPRRLP